MKPRSTWFVTALCLALLCGAMAWTTRSMLRMEASQSRMAMDASVQEMARLALWRMESIASALVIEESSRPPEHYRTFAEPEAVLDNKTYNSVKQGDLVSLSPLLREPPDRVQLYFEMDATGTLHSPQVPAGKELAICQMIGVPPPQSILGCTSQLNALSGLMDKDAGAGKLKALRESLKAPVALKGNRALLWSSNNDDGARPGSPVISAEVPAPQPADKLQEVQKWKSAPSQSPKFTQQSVSAKPEEVQAQQMELNSTEAQARAGILEASKEKAQTRRLNNYENSKSPVQLQKSQDKAEPVQEQVATKELLPPSASTVSRAPAASSAAATQAVPVAPPAPSVPSPYFSTITDLRPLWLGDALLLTRRVATQQKEWIQGAWLDWPRLRSEMLAAVQDRFPNAQVVPAAENPPPGAHLLASLPVQLFPGAVTFAALPFWSPLKASLGIAWLCVLLAVAAVALVLRGMMALSERRASFVSSVTHELRTPLATFKLYSEMLADGMVKEEAKKQQYLETLTGEADRLGHLVENVLAYSRIERGKGPAAAAAVPVSDLLNRIEPRLNQRALMAGMDFSVTAAPEVTSLALRTDAGAVEQILCNLVDNACKYGRRDGAPGEIELVLSKERRRVCFTVRDHGPGIPRGEQNTIFLPFHKSAREAAHTAPGVGLGLALCRRLAAELRGTLEIDRGWKQGAAFVLRLPA